MALNKRKESRTKTERHLNYMGGGSWDINDPFVQLQVAATSCFFGEPSYYQDSDEPQRRRDSAYDSRSLTESERSYLRATLGEVDPKEWRSLTTREMMERAIDAALDADVERTLQFAVTLRNDWHIRTTPQVIMVRAALHEKTHGTSLIGDYAQRIMTRLDEVMNQIAYFESMTGTLKGIPSRLKRAWARRLQTASDYELAKYRMTSRGVNIYDAVNLTHPKSTDALASLMSGNLRLGDDVQTWESIRSSGGSWSEAAEVMGHMALLRNLRNLEQDGSLTSELTAKLIGGVEGGRQLPFRYFSAHRALRDAGARGSSLDAVEECMEASLANLPHFPGRTMSLVDNSGSAQSATTSSMGTMSVASIGNLMGVVTGRCTDDGHVGVFGDRLETFAVRGKASIFDQVEKAERIGRGIGGGTEHGIWLFWDKAIRDKEHWDNVFVYSDMQAGHGGLYGTGGYNDFVWGGRGRGTHIDVPKLIARYRATVNPNVNVFLVQTAGYQDTIVPEWYDRTYILGGWSDKILNFAAALQRDQSTQQVATQ